MNNQQIQQADNAGKRKLTAVTVYLSPSRKHTAFVMLNHDSRGKAILPSAYLDQILSGNARGKTYTVG